MRAILLIDHGSRRPDANDVVVQARRKLEAAGTPLVGHAHLEVAEPTIAQAIDELLERGATELFVQPWFLAPGRHAETDVPAAVRAALGGRAVAVRYGDPFGAADELVARVRRAAG